MEKEVFETQMIFFEINANLFCKSSKRTETVLIPKKKKRDTLQRKNE